MRPPISGFRSELAPASGFSRIQFREIEFLFGAEGPRYLKLVESAEERNSLEARLNAPTLWDCVSGPARPARGPGRRRVYADQNRQRDLLRGVGGPARP